MALCSELLLFCCGGLTRESVGEAAGLKLLPLENGPCIPLGSQEALVATSREKVQYLISIFLHFAATFPYTDVRSSHTCGACANLPARPSSSALRLEDQQDVP